MSINIDIPIPNFIAGSVIGKYQEYYNDYEDKYIYANETLFNLSMKYNVSINYIKNENKINIKGLNKNVQIVIKELQDMIKLKTNKYMEYKQKKKDHKVKLQKNILNNKIKELEKNNLEYIKNKEKEQVKDTKREELIIDNNNRFNILEIDDDDEYFERLKLKQNYDIETNNRTKKIKKIEKNLVKFETNLNNETDNNIISNIKEKIIELKEQLHALINENISFEEYENNILGFPIKNVNNNINSEFQTNNSEINLDLKLALESDNTQLNQGDIECTDYNKELYNNILIPKNRNSYRKKNNKYINNNLEKCNNWSNNNSTDLLCQITSETYNNNFPPLH